MLSQSASHLQPPSRVGVGIDASRYGHYAAFLRDDLQPAAAEPYSAELSRTNPTALIVLIDQSSSMAEPFGVQTDKPKADGVADGINRLLQNLVLKCAKGDGIRDCFHVGVIGYGGRVVWALRRLSGVCHWTRAASAESRWTSCPPGIAR